MKWDKQIKKEDMYNLNLQYTQPIEPEIPFSTLPLSKGTTGAGFIMGLRLDLFDLKIRIELRRKFPFPLSSL